MQRLFDCLSVSEMMSESLVSSLYRRREKTEDERDVRPALLLVSQQRKRPGIHDDDDVKKPAVKSTTCFSSSILCR